MKKLFYLFHLLLFHLIFYNHNFFQSMDLVEDRLLKKYNSICTLQLKSSYELNTIIIILNI